MIYMQKYTPKICNKKRKHIYKKICKKKYAKNKCKTYAKICKKNTQEYPKIHARII